MYKIYIFLLTILIHCSAYAMCESTNSVTKCAMVADFLPSYGVQPSSYTDDSWSVISCKNFEQPCHYYSGASAQIVNSGTTQDKELYCYMTSPFKATIKAMFEDTQSLGTSNPYESCSIHLTAAYARYLLDVSIPSDDKCPDGFYTVPYDISCGEGFVDTTDIPDCSNETQGPFCLIKNVIPCTSGVSVLRTSTGLSFQLKGKKYTEPSLCIGYNGTVCYINLESGSAQNSININYNGSIYHTVN